MLGNAEKRVTEEEENTKQIVRKSVVTRKDVQSGAIINYDDVVIKRPAGGIPPEKIQTIIGKKATHLILADTLIKNEDIN
jgi:sialic acid synthase SpsE